MKHSFIAITGLPVRFY